MKTKYQRRHSNINHWDKEILDAGRKDEETKHRWMFYKHAWLMTVLG
jgi:hypothetical protein